MAYMKTDQCRIKQLLSETIILLCKNGLHFDAEFSIEALIAITLDQKDIFVVSIKETVLVENASSTACSSSSSSTAASNVQIDDRINILSRSSSSDLQKTSSRSTTKRKRRNAATNSSDRERDFASPVVLETSYGSGRSKVGKQETEMTESVSYGNRTNDDDNNKEVGGESLETKDQMNNRDRVVEKTRERVDRTKSEDVSLLTADNHEEFTNNVVYIKHEPVMADEAGGLEEEEEEEEKDEWTNAGLVKILSRSSLGRNSYRACGANESSARDGFSSGDGVNYSSWYTRGFQRNPNSSAKERNRERERETIEESRALCRMWNQVIPPHLVMQMNDVGLNHVSSNRPHPNLTPDELSTATAILTIPGAFINLGCVKAIRQKLRKVPKEVLVVVLESMSVQRDNPYFVGMLRCEGISRTFYKCPPTSVKQEALEYYQLDYAVYADLYNEPVKVPNNIKDPMDWIIKTKMTSPFVEQQF